MRYGSQGYRPRNSNYETKVSGKVKADLGDLGDFVFSTDFVNTDKDIPGPLNESQFLARERIATRKFAGSSMNLYRIGTAYKKAWDYSSLHFNLYYHGKTYDGSYSDDWVEHYNLNLFGSEVRFIQLYNIGNLNNKLTVGASGYTESGTTKIWDRNSDGSKGDLLSKGYGLYRSGGIYGQNTTAMLKPLKVTLGLRYDTIYYKYEDKYPTSETDTKTLHAWSPKFGVTYAFKKNQILYLDIGKGFVPPTLSELFTSRYSNKDLKPQYLTDYEVGIRGTIASKLRYEFAVYYMKFKDQIQYDPNANSYENIGDTKHKGFETSLSYRIMKHITLSGNYSFNISRFDNDPVYGNNFVKRAPKHALALGAIYKNGGLSLGIWMRRIWKYYMDNENTKYYGGHTVVNAKVSYQWKNLFASLYVNNLLDSNYAAWATRYHFGRRILDYYYPGWPINVMFTLGMKF